MMATVVLLELAGYVGLLLWGTNMVTTGVQRGFGAALRAWLEHSVQQRWRAFIAGVGLTALLQSGTATTARCVRGGARSNNRAIASARSSIAMCRPPRRYSTRTCRMPAL